jgi:di/tricarboxylate transporter
MYGIISFSDLETHQKKQFLEEMIFKFTYLSEINNYQLAKYMSFFKVYHCNTNQQVYNKGENAKHIYWILKGEVQLYDVNTQIKIKENEVFGDESLCSNVYYFLNAKTTSESILLVLDTDNAQSLILNNLKVQNIIQKLLIKIDGKQESYTENLTKEIPINDVHKSKLNFFFKRNNSIKILGWLLAITLPFLYYFLMFENPKYYINWNSHIFISIFIAVLIMWAFRLIPEYVTSIFAILSILILNIAPQNIVLSGFTDGSFYLALSIFTLSSLIVSSGFAYRIVLWILRLVPVSTRWYTYSIFFIGFLLTPILPSANGRISLIVPILKDFIHSLGLNHTNNHSKVKGLVSINKIITATFISTTTFSSIFLSSKAIHFVVLGLFPIQLKERFTWSYWLFAAFMAGLILIIGCIFLLEIFYSKTEKPLITKKHIELQYLTLGKISENEYAAIGGLILFIFGIATSSLHKISLPWIGLMILYATLSLGFINHKQFRENIDWTFLIFLASMIGFIKTFSFIGLESVFLENFKWLGIYMQKNIMIFVILCFIIILIMRLFIPTNSAVIILTTILFPIAQTYGINLWIVSFIILMFSDMWFFPYQSTYYIQFENEMCDETYFNEKDLLIFNGISNIFRILAIFISIYYWKQVGIL